jgi:hypothetical protein
MINCIATMIRTTFHEDSLAFWPVKDAMAQNPIKSMGSIQRHAAKSRSFILIVMTGTNISPGAMITFISQHFSAQST